MMGRVFEEINNRHYILNRRAIIYIALWIVAFLSAIMSINSFAHGNGKVHVIEMYSVLPFEAKTDGRAVAENQAIEEWLGMITSDLIDNFWGKACPEFGGRCFYEFLREDFNFRCKHRLLFHWGFNARPWNDELEAKIQRYEWYSDDAKVKEFKDAFVKEQARRNRQANEWTERLFGLSSSGKESAWANGMIAIVYDVHLLGDYLPEDNSDFDGVTKPSLVVRDIINALRRIDSSSSKTLEKMLTAIVDENTDEHKIAAGIISKLQVELPPFLLKANGGDLKKRFLAKGFVLKDC